MSEPAFSVSPRHIFVSMLFAFAIGLLAEKGFLILDSNLVWENKIQASLQWLLGISVVLTSARP